MQYYSMALSSPFGQKVRAFYTTTTKQVLDIHDEAKRIASSSAPNPAPATGETPAAPPVPPKPIDAAAVGTSAERPPTTTAPTVV